MASFEILWKNSGEKEIRRLDRKIISRLLKCIDDLSQNPFPSNHKKLQGTDLTYRISIGDYRIVYQVDIKERIVIIQHIRHRKDVYRKY